MPATVNGPQVQQIAPLFFPKVDPEKILFISNRVPLENNTSSDWTVLLKGAQSRNVSTVLSFIATCSKNLPTWRDVSPLLRSTGRSLAHEYASHPCGNFGRIE